MEFASQTSRRTMDLGGLRLDARVSCILVIGTLLLLLDHYHQLLPGSTFAEAARGKAIERVAYYLVIPVLLIRFGFRDSLSEYGFTLGDWRQGLKWTAVSILLGAPLLALAAGWPAVTAYYERFHTNLVDLSITAALDLVGWEFFFRGLLLFSLMRLMGPTAVVAQAVPFALAHIGKPEVEALSAIFSGAFFGWVAWRSRSFWYAFLIHWFVYTWIVVMVQL